MPNKHHRPLRLRHFEPSPRIALINVVAMVIAGGFFSGRSRAFAQEPALSETQSPAIPKEELRYAGRSFGEWQRQLLTDLEPNSQIAAIEALLAFGKKGYEEETVAAIGQVLATSSEKVQQNAFGALGEIGTASVPVLAGALRAKDRSVRARAASTLAGIGPAAQAALDPLRQAVQDEDQFVRHVAAQGLAKVGAGEKHLLPAFEQLARSEDMHMRLAVLSGLSDAVANHPRLVPIFLRALEDDHWEIRRSAGEALIHGGPPHDDVVEGLAQLVREDIEGYRRRRQFDTTAGRIVLSLAREERNVDTVAPVLAEAAAVVLADRVFILWSGLDELLAALLRLGPNAAPAAPALAKFIAIDSPARESSIILAIDALRSIGAAAREAAAALEAWIAVRERANVDLDTIQRHAVKALRSVND